MSMAAVKPALVGSSKSAFKGSRVSAVAPKKVAGGRATLQVRTPEVASPSPSAVRAPARGDANAPAPAIARGLEARAPRRAPRGRGPRPRAIAPRARRERARTDGTRKRNRGPPRARVQGYPDDRREAFRGSRDPERRDPATRPPRGPRAPPRSPRSRASRRARAGASAAAPRPARARRDRGMRSVPPGWHGDYPLSHPNRPVRDGSFVPSFTRGVAKTDSPEKKKAAPPLSAI